MHSVYVHHVLIGLGMYCKKLLHYSCRFRNNDGCFPNRNSPISTQSVVPLLLKIQDGWCTSMKLDSECFVLCIVFYEFISLFTSVFHSKSQLRLVMILSVGKGEWIFCNCSSFPVHKSCNLLLRSIREAVIKDMRLNERSMQFFSQLVRSLAVIPLK